MGVKWDGRVISKVGLVRKWAGLICFCLKQKGVYLMEVGWDGLDLMALKVEKNPAERKPTEEKKTVAEKTPAEEEAQSREEAAEGGRSRRLGCWRRRCSSSLEPPGFCSRLSLQ
ncbi:hypothetical protein U1Q18_001501 [Sarracenia purpurea var. burkii]